MPSHHHHHQKPPPEPEYHDTVEITARGGYSRYYAFGLYTTGLEVSARVVANLHPVLGAELFVVRRVYPPAVALEKGVYNDWELLYPVNVGAIYKFSDGQFQPYAGAELVFVDYYHDATKHYIATGGRVRGGLDFEIIDHLALNANVNLGAWSGSQWSTVDQDLKNTGIIGELSAGVVVGF